MFSIETRKKDMITTRVIQSSEGMKRELHLFVEEYVQYSRQKKLQFLVAVFMPTQFRYMNSELYRSLFNNGFFIIQFC